MFAWTSHGTELKRFFRQPITRMALVVLLLIPLLYGAMYVWAFWNPVDRLDDLPVALVNQDVAVQSNGRTVHAGTDVVTTLVDRKPLGWHLVDSSTAADGVKSGKYYFSVTIPATFSSDIVSLGSQDPTSAEIKVTYNDSNSFLATELGSNAMTQIRDVVSQKIGQTAAKTLVVGLGDARNGMTKASDGAFVLQDGLKKAKDGSTTLSVGTRELAAGTAQLAAGAGTLADGTASAAGKVSTMASGVSRLNTGAEQLSAGLTALQKQTPTLVNGINSLASGAARSASGARDLSDAQARYVTGVSTASAGAQHLSTGLDSALAGARTAGKGAAELSNGASDLTGLQKGLAQAADTTSGAPALADGATRLANQFGTLVTGVSELSTGASHFSSGATTFSSGATSFASGAKRWTGGAQTWLSGAQTASGSLKTGASQVADGATSLSRGARTLAAATGKDSTLHQGAAQVAAGTDQTATQLKQINAAVIAARAELDRGDTAGANRILSGLETSTGQSAQRQASDLAAGASQVRDGIYSSGGTTSVHAAAQSLADGASQVSSGSSQLSRGAGSLAGAVSSNGPLGTGLSTLSGSVPTLSGAAQTLTKGSGELASGSASLATGAKTLSGSQGSINQLMVGSKALSSGITQMSTKASTGIPTLQKGLVQLSDGLNNPHSDRGLVAGLAQLDTGARSLSGGFTNPDPGRGLVAGAKAISAGSQQLAAGTSKISSGAGALASGATTLTSGANQLAAGGKQVASGTGQLNAKVPALVSGVAALDQGAQKIHSATTKVDSGAATLAARTPTLTTGLSTLEHGATTLGNKLSSGAGQIPHDSASVQTQRARAVSSPVGLAKHNLHQAASWGEFFAPFFIGLGLWVGALVAWLLLRPLQSRALMTSVSGFRMAWGSLNSALTLAVGQVFIMLSVMHFAIGINPNHAVATVLFALLVAAAFFALQQMLQIGFGSAIGKVIIISVLMLQLASAGGTYPIQTEPGFFQAVSPWMPMTYVVNGLRQAITGSIGPRFWTAVAVMAGIFVVSLVLSSILAARKRTWTLSRLHPALKI